MAEALEVETLHLEAPLLTSNRGVRVTAVQCSTVLSPCCPQCLTGPHSLMQESEVLSMIDTSLANTLLSPRPQWTLEGGPGQS